MDLIDLVARRWSRVVPAAVAATAVTLGGCALGISGPQPNRARLETPRCDTGKGGVVIDALWAGALGIGGLSAISNDEPEIGALVVATAALFASSAFRGNSRANQCVDAYGEYNAEVIAARAAPPREDDEVRGPEPWARRGPIAPRPASTAPSAPRPERAPVATGEPPAPAARPAPFMTPRPPAPTAPPPTAPATKPAPADDDWSEFWKEVP